MVPSSQPADGVAASASHGLLGPKIRSAYAWSIAGTVARHLFQFVISILLARLLSPADYGLVGMVTVFVGMLSIVQDLGIGRAIVHFEDGEETIPSYVTTAAVVGLILTGIAFAGAPLVSAFYHEPRLTAIVRALSVTIVLSSLQSVAYGILSKRFHFRALSIIELAASAGSGLIALWLALAGWGAWSLVWNMILFTAIQTLGTCILAPPRFTLHPQRDIVRKLLRYGLPLSGSAMLFQFYDNADYLVVGKMAGATPLGLYTLAFRLATMAYEKIGVVINRVAFPSFAAMQQDREALVRHWYQVSRVISLLNFPVLAFLFVNAEDTLLVLVGPKWLAAALPLRFLCMVGLLRGLSQLTQHIFSALGATMVRLHMSVVSAIVLPVSFAIGAKYWGLAGVGMAWCVVYPFLFLYLLHETRKLVKFRWRDYLAALRLPVLVTLACTAAMAPARLLLAPGLDRLLLAAALGGLSFAAIAIPARRRLFA